ncbi:MAG: undecaprenyl-diphosphate phosphatase [Patescibacteria group bacterium]|nr:undecaprenyl-diphosphate phosphatase [Patescibacteria group bacterium]MCL5431616.1 undecaprenyl-diphosphate phosphatase [Patescibacteria group bacterium]
MNPLQALVLGVVEGATEYLPISSTFHLIWASHFLGLAQSDFQKAFEVIIQAGAILAVVVLYLPRWRQKISLFPKIAASFIPTAVIGLLFYKIIKDVFFTSDLLQLGVFAIVGAVFIIYERFFRPDLSRPAAAITFRQAILIGVVQALAIVPGVSRAGAVILGLMFLRVKRDEAAEYSFLLAVPTLLAASGLDLVKSAPYLLHHLGDIGILAIGFGTAFVSALFAVKWFLAFLQHHTLTSFGLYRLVLAGAIIFSLAFSHP